MIAYFVCSRLFVVVLQVEIAVAEGNWLDDIISKCGENLKLTCPWVNEPHIVSWWRTGTDYVPKKVSNQSEFMVEPAYHEHSGMYECFNSYGNNKPYELYKRNVLIIETYCDNTRKRSDPSKKVMIIKHLHFPMVEFKVQQANCIQSMRKEIVSRDSISEGFVMDAIELEECSEKSCSSKEVEFLQVNPLRHDSASRPSEVVNAEIFGIPRVVLIVTISICTIAFTIIAILAVVSAKSSRKTRFMRFGKCGIYLRNKPTLILDLKEDC